MSRYHLALSLKLGAVMLILIAIAGGLMGYHESTTTARKTGNIAMTSGLTASAPVALDAVSNPAAPRIKTTEFAEGNLTSYAQPAASGDKALPSDSRIIRTASLVFQVKDYGTTRRQLHELLSTSDVTIFNENETRAENQLETALTLKVSPAKFVPILAQLESHCGRLEAKNIEAVDVGEEYVDIQARLTAKKAIEGQYLQLLHRSGSISDILKVQTQLGQIREQIEQIEGRKRYLDRQTTQCTINLRLYQMITTLPQAGTSFGGRLAQALLMGWLSLTAWIIRLAALWPVLLISAALVAMASWIRRD